MKYEPIEGSLSFLYVQAVSAHDFVSSFPDAIFLVEEKDALKTYQAIEKVSKET